jgi:hypothetical protein
MINILDMIEKHTITLPLSQKQIVIRPVLVKEEKILLMGRESGTNDMLSSIVQVVQNCTLTENFSWMNQSFSDFCYTFIQLRKISKDNTINLNLYCFNGDCEHSKDDKPVKKKFKIDDIVKIKNENAKHSSIVKLNDKVGVQMIPITVEFVVKTKNSNLFTENVNWTFDDNFNAVKEHIVSIVNEQENFNELTEQDKTNFIEMLNKNQFLELLKWHLEEVKPEINFEWKCKCGNMNIVKGVDIINFFDLS